LGATRSERNAQKRSPMMASETIEATINGQIGQPAA
jgi:hypothetical protein